MQANLADGTRDRPYTIASARRHNEKDFRSSLPYTPRCVALVHINFVPFISVTLRVFSPNLTQDKKVLRFWGYFEEVIDPSIVGSAPLDSAARKVSVDTHLADIISRHLLSDCRRTSGFVNAQSCSTWKTGLSKPRRSARTTAG